MPSGPSTGWSGARLRIAVIGAGEMGHGLAELAALHGHDVRLRDIKKEYIDRGMERIRWSLGKLVEKKQITEAQADEALGRIHATLELREACHDADFVIEAVFEDPELKRKVFRELDETAPPKTILASNTSALPITDMASATKRPKKVVGMHFFNPPMLMPLVEVIRADTTSDATLQAVVELAKSFGKTVVVVKKDVPGFITTRVLGPYFEQAAWIHEREGMPIETIDAAMRFRAGFPMGPFELADQVGVDVLHHLIMNAHQPMPRSVQDLVDRKKLGHKVGEGFYAYKEGRPKLTPEMGQAFDPIRILAPMINEAAELVAMDVASPSEIDEAMRLGTAFPKGPLATADDLGIDIVLAALKDVKDVRPAKLLEEMAARGDLGVKSGKGFYDHGSGGGLETALACDFRIAASRAKLGQTEVNLGLVPGAGGSQRLVRVVGQAKAKELVFLGSRLTADEAATIGLVTKTVPNEAFAAEVRGFAEKLAKQAPIAIRLAKVLLNRSADTPIDVALEMEAMAFGLISSTEDIYEGLQAFMEKREPKFKGG